MERRSERIHRSRHRNKERGGQKQGQSYLGSAGSRSSSRGIGLVAAIVGHSSKSFRRQRAGQGVSKRRGRTVALNFSTSHWIERQEARCVSSSQ